MKLLIKDDRHGHSSNERILLDLQGSIEVEDGVDKVDVGNIDMSNPVSGKDASNSRV